MRVIGVIVGIVFGLFSGFLIYMGAVMLFISDKPSSVFVVFVFVTFLGGWAISSWIIIRRTRTLSKVFSRGFLLGAAEWLAIIPIGLIFSGRFLSETLTQGDASSAEAAGATIGVGLVSIMTGGVAVAMAVICLIGFAISYFIGREMKPEIAPATRQCPECAELIQIAALKCKHCGSDITKAD